MRDNAHRDATRMDHSVGDHELFDVVDDADRIVGRMRRDDVHRFQLRHRAAHVLVVNSRREIFVQRRSAWKECAPGLWDTSAAGHVESGESYAACAVRELGEELGLFVTAPLRRIGYLEASPATGWEFVTVFLCRSDARLTPCPDEIAEGRWMRPEQIGEWMNDRPGDFTGTFRLIFQRSRIRLRERGRSRHA